MEGIDIIQDRILEQAREKASEIESAGRNQCEEILASAREECQQIKAAVELKTKSQVDAILNRARSMAAMESRKLELQKRQQLIDQVIDRAVKKVSTMPGAKKLELYSEMIRRLGVDNGEITLSQTDADIAEALLAKLGSGFSVISTSGKFSSGLILGRGRIEDNLTVDLIVRNQRPQLSAVAAQALPQKAQEAGKELI